MAWNANIDMANQISADIPQIDDNFDHLQAELAHEHDWVVGTAYSGQHLGGSARALQATVAYSDAGLAIAGTTAAADAAQASPYTDRRLLIDSVGRQYYFDVAGGNVWKPLCSTRISRKSSNAATSVGPLAGSPTWAAWDAANLDITKTVDDTSGDWIEKCEFQGTFTADGAGILEVRIYDNTAAAVVGAAQGMAGASGDRVPIHILAYYRPAASAATTFKIQISGTAGRTWGRSVFNTTATYIYNHFSVSEVPA